MQEVAELTQDEQGDVQAAHLLSAVKYYLEVQVIQ